MTLSEKQRRFTWLVSCLIDWAYGNGYELVLGHAYRSPEEQKRLYDAGISPTLKSKHKKCLAIDLNLFKDGVYLTKTEDHEPLGKYWESLDDECVWGGRFSDGNHYQYTK
jgi:hypothetical protein